MGKKSTNQISIQQIAEAAGVSTATVSRVFNRHSYVSEDVRRKVVAAARAAGYAPTISSSRNLFGILCSEGKRFTFNGYYNQVLDATSQVFFESGYNLQIFSAAFFPYILRNTFRGVITMDAKTVPFFRKAKIPCVTINQPVQGGYSVVTDHFESLKIAVSYLLDLGHRRIAYLHAPELNSWGSAERMRGYLETLAAAGEQPLAETFADSIHDIPIMIPRLLARKPTALIVEGENNGLIADHVLKDLNVRIPEDLSLLTFECSGISEFMTPEHTTVCQDFTGLGRCAAETLIRYAMHPSERKEIPLIQTFHNHLIVRASCAPLKNQ